MDLPSVALGFGTSANLQKLGVHRTDHVRWDFTPLHMFDPISHKVQVVAIGPCNHEYTMLFCRHMCHPLSAHSRGFWMQVKAAYQRMVKISEIIDVRHDSQTLQSGSGYLLPASRFPLQLICCGCWSIGMWISHALNLVLVPSSEEYWHKLISGPVAAEIPWPLIIPLYIHMCWLCLPVQGIVFCLTTVGSICPFLSCCSSLRTSDIQKVLSPNHQIMSVSFAMHHSASRVCNRQSCWRKRSKNGTKCRSESLGISTSCLMSQVWDLHLP